MSPNLIAVAALISAVGAVTILLVHHTIGIWQAAVVITMTTGAVVMVSVWVAPLAPIQRDLVGGFW